MKTMGAIQENREKVLEDLDNAKTGKFHFKAIFITGMGFFQMHTISLSFHPPCQSLWQCSASQVPATYSEQQP
jgi:hypothetical protein